ncbi:MAG: universal stress protein [Gammaproteobacteria bacterium]|jgi:nucleotide-binding universal stress UspA family protein
MNNDKPVVMACIDDSKLSDAVCDYAVWIAQRVDVPLKLLNTIDHHPETAENLDLSGSLGVNSRAHLLEDITDVEHAKSKALIQKGKTILEAAKARVKAQGYSDPVVSLQHGSLIDSLIELEQGIRVLVIGARGKIHEDMPDKIGAKLEDMIRSLHLPILVAYEEFKKPENIMIAYDGSDCANKAVEMVANSPLYKGLTCHLVNVSNNSSAEELLQKAANTLRDKSDLKIITASLSGKAEQALCDYQKQQNIELTIMGAFSHTRLHDILLGSFTVKMLLNTNNPLLLLR